MKDWSVQRGAAQTASGAVCGNGRVYSTSLQVIDQGCVMSHVHGPRTCFVYLRGTSVLRGSYSIPGHTGSPTSDLQASHHLFLHAVHA
ncbi:hypothetical protein J6590_060421 [Homalodisca vitripennis]|nr:hypothetical protein J6590_060421 [Homalodisca vitripennis]